MNSTNSERLFNDVNILEVKSMRKIIFVLISGFIISCASTPDSGANIVSNEVSSTSIGESKAEIVRRKMPEENWAYYITAKNQNEANQFAFEIWKETHNLQTEAFKKNSIPDNTRTIKYLEYGNGCFVIQLQSDRLYKFPDTFVSISLGACRT